MPPIPAGFPPPSPISIAVRMTDFAFKLKATPLWPVGSRSKPDSGWWNSKRRGNQMRPSPYRFVLSTTPVRNGPCGKPPPQGEKQQVETSPRSMTGWIGRTDASLPSQSRSCAGRETGGRLLDRRDLDGGTVVGGGIRVGVPVNTQPQAEPLRAFNPPSQMSLMKDAGTPPRCIGLRPTLLRRRMDSACTLAPANKPFRKT
jgi:hypothetical protein